MLQARSGPGSRPGAGHRVRVATGNQPKKGGANRVSTVVAVVTARRRIRFFAVENHSEGVDPGGVQRGAGSQHDIPGRSSGANNEHDAVGLGSNDSGVRHRQRRCVDKNDLIVSRGGVEELRQPIRVQKSRGIGWNRTTRRHEQIGDRGFVNLGPRGNVPRQEEAEPTFIADRERFGEVWLAQVGLDQQCRETSFGKRLARDMSPVSSCLPPALPT